MFSCFNSLFNLNCYEFPKIESKEVIVIESNIMDREVEETTDDIYNINIPSNFDKNIFKLSYNEFSQYKLDNKTPIHTKECFTKKWFLIRYWSIFYSCKCYLDDDKLIVSFKKKTNQNEKIVNRIKANMNEIMDIINYNINYNIHVFVDISNVLISAQQIISVDNPNIYTKDNNIRLSIKSLTELIIGLRTVKSLYARGSFKSKAQQDMTKFWKDCDYNIKNIYRDKQETFVDESLIAEAQNIMITNINNISTEVIIFISGDGNGNKGATSFRRTIINALHMGYIVEVWTWMSACNNFYKSIRNGNCNELTKEQSSRFRLYYLDNYRDGITFTSSISRP